MQDKAKTGESFGAQLVGHNDQGDETRISGRFVAVCRDKDGNIKWEDEFSNLITTAGKNAILNQALAGSGYSVTGPYMGLISSASYSAVAAGDTMSSHAGWVEAGPSHAPNYSGNRKTCAFSAASGGAKSLSAALSFTFSETGTVKGGFIVFGSGAVNTKDDTNGVLLSAGLFSGGDRSVLASDVLSVSYTATLT